MGIVRVKVTSRKTHGQSTLGKGSRGHKRGLKGVPDHMGP